MTFQQLYKFKINRKICNKICYTLYDAIDLTDDKRVFLKVLDEKLAQNNQYVVNFMSSAHMLKLFKNPNIYNVYDYGSDRDQHFISAEPVDWEPINSLIKETFSLSFQDLIEIFIRITSTVRYAHLHGMSHGILNPKSIYINSDGNIKIDDFGFSWFTPEIFKDEQRESLYLTQYISPEIYDSIDKTDSRIDIYSIGIILYQFLAGSPPYTGSSVAEIQDKHIEAKLSLLNMPEDVPPELDAIVTKALQTEPEKRYQNLKQFVEAFKKLNQQFFNVNESSDLINPAEVDFKYELEKTQKHFFEDDIASDNKQNFSSRKTKEPSYRRATTFNSKKWAWMGLALILLVSIILVSTNQLPLPFLKTTEPDYEFSEFKSTANPVDQLADILPESPQTESSLLTGQDIEEVVSQPDSMTELLVSNHSKPELPEESAAPTKSAQPLVNHVESKKVESQSEPKKGSEAITKRAEKVSDRPKVVNAPKPKPAKNTQPPAAKTAAVTFNVKANNKPIQALVFVNDQFKGKTSASGLLKLDKLQINQSYTVRVSQKGYETVTQQFTATNTSPVLNFDLKPKLDIFGKIILDPQPKADSIFVDGNLYRQNGQPLEITLPWGEHQIRFVNASLKKSWQQTVNLKVGQVLRVKHDFAKAEFGKVAISLKNAATFGFGYVYIDGNLWGGTPNTTPLEVKLPVGSHTIEVRREGFNSIPRDIIVVVEKGATKRVAFTFSKM